jgi:dihydrofolate reductase
MAGDQGSGGGVSGTAQASKGMRPLVIVAAVARNRVIGGDNRLLWKLRSDMQHFRALTMGKPLIMGRKTFESIGRPLPGRETIVVTHDRNFRPEGVHLAHGLDAALALAQDCAERLGADAIVIAGGGELYGQLIGECRVLHLTEVDLAPEGDALFPEIDPGLWRETRRETHGAGPGDEAGFAFVDYVRT